MFSLTWTRISLPPLSASSPQMNRMWQGYGSSSLAQAVEVCSSLRNREPRTMKRRFGGPLDSACALRLARRRPCEVRRAQVQLRAPQLQESDSSSYPASWGLRYSHAAL